MGGALDHLAQAGPAGRPGLPEEIAAAIAYLVGEAAADQTGLPSPTHAFFR